MRGDPKRLQRSFFRTQTVQLRGIVRQFEATAEDNYRGDREQTVCQMHQTYIENAREFKRLRGEYMDNAGRLAGKGNLITVSRDRPAKEVLSTFYCERLLGGLATALLPKKAKAQPPTPQRPVLAPPTRRRQRWCPRWIPGRRLKRPPVACSPPCPTR